LPTSKLGTVEIIAIGVSQRSDRMAASDRALR
jgi:hypothetical protein